MVTKAFYKSKLFWLGAIEIAIGGLALLGPFLEAGVFTPVAFAVLLSGVLTVALRFVTDQPIAISA